MGKTIDTLAAAALTAVLAGGCVGGQYGLYKLTERSLETAETAKGQEYAVQLAKDRLTANMNPLNYLFVPGYRVALLDYIEDH